MASDMGDGQDGLMNGSMDSRTSSFANSFLGLPGLLPGPSGMNDNFGEFKFLYFFPCILKIQILYDYYFFQFEAKRKFVVFLLTPKTE